MIYHLGEQLRILMKVHVSSSTCIKGFWVESCVHSLFRIEESVLVSHASCLHERYLPY